MKVKLRHKEVPYTEHLLTAEEEAKTSGWSNNSWE